MALSAFGVTVKGCGGSNGCEVAERAYEVTKLTEDAVMPLIFKKYL